MDRMEGARRRSSIAPERLHSVHIDEKPATIASHLHELQAKNAAARRRVIQSVCMLYLGSLSFGITAVYSAPALPDIRKNMEFSKDSGDWFGSVLNIGGVLGAIFAGYMINRVGRKRTIMMSMLCFVFGWTCVMLGGHAVMLLFVGRCLSGFAVGIIALTLPVFISEISPPDIRGQLNSASVAVLHAGILVVFVLGKWLGYVALAGVSMIPVALLIPCLYFIKESPTWLLEKERKSEAVESLHFYVGPNITDDMCKLQAKISTGEQFTFSELKLPYIYKPFLCTLLAMFLQQFSGVAILLYFAHDIFEASGSTMSSSDCAITVGLVQVFTVMLSTFLTDRLGRKILFLASVTISSLSLLALGLCFYFKKVQGEAFVSTFGWAPVLAVSVYFFGYSLGLGGLPWVLLGEVLPQRVKGFATGFCTAFNFATGFVVVKEFQDFLHFFGSEGIYWFYSAILGLGFVLFLFFVPETKGKTLEEIEELFGKTCAEGAAPPMNVTLDALPGRRPTGVFSNAIYAEVLNGQVGMSSVETV
ncbi:facilitated trehalose transporter Tret1-like isoform X2 [Ornithodoros turicata]|uniref:facilitated trehalose transporter Tret1-like isoform X2 n=1 Tax=Ornithodoros turicata TaxID=34597 RepID=UPI003138D587